jgi:hypothetical protein
MHRVTLVLLTAAFGCTTGLSSTGSEGDDGNADTSGSTTSSELQDCGEGNTNSMLIDGACWCSIGDTWEDPFNPSSFVCVEVAPRPGECADDNGVTSGGTCDCLDHYAWCVIDENPEDDEVPKSTACCYDPSQYPPLEGETTTTTTDASTGADTSTGDASTDSSSTGSSSDSGSSSGESTGASSSSGG